MPVRDIRPSWALFGLLQMPFNLGSYPAGLPQMTNRNKKNRHCILLK